MAQSPGMQTLATVGNLQFQGTCWSTGPSNVMMQLMATKSSGSGSLQVQRTTSVNDGPVTTTHSGIGLDTTTTVADLLILAGDYERSVGTAWIDLDGKQYQVDFHLFADRRSTSAVCDVYGSVIPTA